MAFKAAPMFTAAVALSTAALLAGTTLPASAAAPASPPSPSKPAAEPSGRFQRGLVRKGPDREAKARRPHALAAAGEHVLKVELLGRDGRPTTTDHNSRLYVWPLNGDMPLGLDVVDGHAEGPVPDGDYVLSSKIYDTAPDGRESVTLLYAPKVQVGADTALTLDGRAARPIKVTADRADASAGVTAAVVSQRLGDHYQAVTTMAADDLYATPAAPGGDLHLDVAAQLTKDGAQTGSPYLYNISSSVQGIPADPSVRVRTADLAEVRTRYASPGGASCAGAHFSPLWTTSAQYGFYNRIGALPTERTEYYTPGVDWYVDQATDRSCAFDEYDLLFHHERFSGPGRHTRTVGQAPFGPSQGEFTPDGDGQNVIQIPLVSSADAETSGGGLSLTQGTTSLTDASGAVVATSSVPGYLNGWEPAKPGSYTLTVDAKRSAPWTDFATREHITWNVKVTDSKATLPIGAVRYKAPGLDASNRAAAGSFQTLGLTPDGVTTSATPKVWTSTDDGTTWQSVPVVKSGTGWTAAYRNPARAGYVSLRTQVDGVVDQTVIRAYGVR
ncbi:hypothetical protein DZF91_20995 [Actinomadura logoneensis]|uniref:Uncharacterized protein n=1 Tax=Actinomadura logoneensis TaxID=2293572 RepID=A0A372JI72_9ACTN|nr:hypothetical protein [Actinomadura logoneensis]RFU39703.1 hypothetical protein DZF91_20995 [Actinomadura logoneensis]